MFLPDVNVQIVHLLKVQTGKGPEFRAEIRRIGAVLNSILQQFLRF